MEQARFIPYCELEEGTIRERDYVITQDVYDHFLSAFDDRSPIHVDDERARAVGFAGKVMHGAILSGFVSHFVGMVFPGANSLLLSMELRFSQPSYLGETLRLRGKIVQRLDARHVIVMQLEAQNITRGLLAASARLQIQIRSV